MACRTEPYCVLRNEKRNGRWAERAVSRSVRVRDEHGMARKVMPFCAVLIEKWTENFRRSVARSALYGTEFVTVCSVRNGILLSWVSVERSSVRKRKGGGWRRAYRITIGYGVRKHVLNRASLAYSLSTIDNKIFIRLLQVSSLLLRDHSYPRLRELSCEYHQFAKPCRQSIRKTTARIVVIACQELSTAFERPSDLRYAPICSICSPLRAY